VAPPTARAWWLALEPVHAVVYFDEDCRASMTGLGLRGFWMGYFAGRAAPLGPASPDLVAATFFNFAPPMVARALPDAWAIADPHRVWAARRAGAAGALRRMAPDVDDLAGRALPLLARAVAAGSVAGRPLFAATRAAGWPDDPVEALWHACTCLREHRGDGHVAALTASGLDAVEALVLFAASEGLPEALFLAARGWSADDWAAATGRLQDRGLFGAAGITAAGTRLRHTVEAMTDLQAARPYAALGGREQQELSDLVGPLGEAIHHAGVIAYPNPMGLPEPTGA
jgi:hypothetical protein